MTNDYRIQQLEREVTALEQKAEVIPVLQEQIASLKREIVDSKQSIIRGFENVDKRFDKSEEDQKATRRVTMAFAFTVAGACVTTLLTLLATGTIG
jgi:hypothetical protein